MKVAHVFDFDDTLSHSDAMIYVRPFYEGVPVEIGKIPGLEKVKFSKLEYLPNALKYSFSSHQFAELSRLIDLHSIKTVEEGGDLLDGHVLSLDFSDIIHVDEFSAKPILINFQHLQKAHNENCHIWILTGRKSGGEQGIVDFVFKHSGVKIPIGRVICVGGWGDSTHKSKGASFINGSIPSHIYDRIYFYDDDARNLNEVKAVVAEITRIFVINSITGNISSDIKDRVEKARLRRVSESAARRIRKLSNGIGIL